MMINEQKYLLQLLLTWKTKGCFQKRKTKAYYWTCDSLIYEEKREILSWWKSEKKKRELWKCGLEIAEWKKQRKLCVVFLWVPSGLSCGAMSQESFIYSFVARGTVVLAEYTEFTGNFPAIAAQCLHKLSSSNNKFTYNCDHHTFNFLVEDGYGNVPYPVTWSYSFLGFFLFWVSFLGGFCLFMGSSQILWIFPLIAEMEQLMNGEKQNLG